MQVKSTAECSVGALRNTFDIHLTIIGLENLFLNDRFRQVSGFSVVSESDISNLLKGDIILPSPKPLQIAVTVFY